MRRFLVLAAASLLTLSCSHLDSASEREREREEEAARIVVSDAQASAYLNTCFNTIYTYPWRQEGRCARYDVEKTTSDYIELTLHVADECANNPDVVPVDERFRVYKHGGKVEYWSIASKKWTHYVGCRPSERKDEGEENEGKKESEKH